MLVTKRRTGPAGPERRGTLRRLMVIFLAAVLLSGCAGAPRETPAQVPDAAPAAAAAAESTLSAAQLEAGPRPLTEEEVLSAYRRAEEAWAWFCRDPLPDSGETLRLEGAVYRKVDSPGLETAGDLRAYLRGLFSAELTDSLLSAGDPAPLYRDIDGVLYVSLEPQSGEDRRGGTQVGVVQVDGWSYALEVSVELLDGQGNVTGVECWSFPYAYVDGRWVFTDFQLVT